MTDRLPWKREGEQSYVAYPTGSAEGGEVRVWYGEYFGLTAWQAKAQIGPIVVSDMAVDETLAAASAARLWSAAQERHAAFAAAVDEMRAMLTKIEDAVSGRSEIDVAAFDLDALSGERLLALMAMLSRFAPIPALHPLTSAASAELHKRRLEGRPALDLGIYGDMHVVEAVYGR